MYYEAKFMFSGGFGGGTVEIDRWQISGAQGTEYGEVTAEMIYHIMCCNNAKIAANLFNISLDQVYDAWLEVYDKQKAKR